MPGLWIFMRNFCLPTGLGRAGNSPKIRLFFIIFTTNFQIWLYCMRYCVQKRVNCAAQLARPCKIRFIRTSDATIIIQKKKEGGMPGCPGTYSGQPGPPFAIKLAARTSARTVLTWPRNDFCRAAPRNMPVKARRHLFLVAVFSVRVF